MSGTEPIGSIDFTALMLPTEACALGDCLVYDSALAYFRVATAAHRTSASAGTQAIARSAYGGAEVGKVKYQTAGVLAQSVTGLAALTPSTTKKLVRTSSAGRLERVDSYTAGDDIVGYATWDGRVALHLGLPWEYIATFAGVPPGLPAQSIQYYATSTTLGGAAHAGISTDGYIETRSANEAVASSGHWRVGINPGNVLSTLRSSDSAVRSMLNVSTNTWTLGSTSDGRIANVSGTGMVLRANGSSAIVGASIFVVSTGAGGAEVERFWVDTTEILSKLPRYGFTTAWGASEGEILIANTGSYALTGNEYIYASIRFSGAGTGTYTLPAPTALQSYFKFLQETGGVSKTITTGSGTAYTLAANTSAWVKVTNLGVFPASAGGVSKCLVTFTGSAVANTTTFLNAYGIPQATEAGFTIRSICVTADDVASAGTYSVQVTVNGTAISPALAFVVTTSTSSGQASLVTPYAISAGDAIGVKVVGSGNSEAPNLGFNVTVCVGSGS